MNGKQLKNSILQWAIQGKLVPQDPNDEPASVLLEKIRAEKARLVKEGKLKKKELIASNIFKDEDGRWLEIVGKETTDVTDVIPFDVPNNWKWVRLKDIVSLITKGSSPSWQGVKYVDGGILFITSENVREGFLDISSPKYLEEKFNNLQSRSILKKGDLLTNIVGASIGRTAEFDLDLDNCNINQAVAIIRLINLSLNAFLLKVFNSPFVIIQMLGKTVETARPNISLGSVENLFIPLPPLAEQHRIVAKIEEMMPLVEKYGAAQETLNEWNKALPEKLKKSILQEAIQGKLVPQDPADEPASALLERIREEKKRLVKEGKLKKKDLEVKPIEEDEIPFEIPDNWEWVRWGELGEYKKGPFGSSLTKSMFVPKTDEAVKVYEQKNAIQKDYTLGEYYISKEKYETMTGFTVRPGDIIVSCAGTIGETYLLPPEAPIGIINQALMRAKLHLDSIIPYWLLYFQYILLIENKLKGSGSAIKNIPPFEVLKAMPVPLPPLAEQRRIVAKIEELFGVIG